LKSIGIEDLVLRPRYVYVLKHDEVKMLMKRQSNTGRINQDDWRYTPPEVIKRGVEHELNKYIKLKMNTDT